MSGGRTKVAEGVAPDRVGVVRAARRVVPLDQQSRPLELVLVRRGRLTDLHHEHGIKHCPMSITYSHQHFGSAIPPNADAGWIGEAWPGSSYLDRDLDRISISVDNDYSPTATPP